MATVLLVDDDRALRKLLRAYLEAESISVIEAASGEEGLVAIERSAPMLVLLDVRLPRIDGFEVLRRLDSVGRSVPVILVAVRDRGSQWCRQPVPKKLPSGRTTSRVQNARMSPSTPIPSFSRSHDAHIAGTSRISGTLAGASPAWTREHRLHSHGMEESCSIGAGKLFSTPRNT